MCFLGYGKNRVFLALAFKCPHSRVWCTTAWVNGTLVEAVDSKYGEPAIWSSGCNHPRHQALAYGDAVDV